MRRTHTPTKNFKTKHRSKILASYQIPCNKNCLGPRATPTPVLDVDPPASGGCLCRSHPRILSREIPPQCAACTSARSPVVPAAKHPRTESPAHTHRVKPTPHSLSLSRLAPIPKAHSLTHTVSHTTISLQNLRGPRRSARARPCSSIQSNRASPYRPLHTSQTAARPPSQHYTVPAFFPCVFPP